jgi:hypothetical protein
MIDLPIAFLSDLVAPAARVVVQVVQTTNRFGKGVGSVFPVRTPREKDSRP